MNNDRFKFRAWDKEKRKYEYEIEHIWENGENIPDIMSCYCFGDVIDHADKFVIEQCTGVKDKNGNLIYEGDIVIGSWNTKLIVVWDEICVSYRVKPLSGIFGDRDFHYFSNSKNLNDGTLSFSEFEIIGNIHEMTK